MLCAGQNEKRLCCGAAMQNSMTKFTFAQFFNNYGGFKAEALRNIR
jgi:hypothetical protein